MRLRDLTILCIWNIFLAIYTVANIVSLIFDAKEYISKKGEKQNDI